MTDAAPNIPQSIAAEATVLGAMILDAAAVPIARQIVSYPDFFRPAHQIIFRGACWMNDNGAKVGKLDLVTFSNALAKRNQLENVGGTAYLIALAEGVPDTTNVEHYARIVRDAARLRAAILAGTQFAEGARNAEDVAEFLGHWLPRLVEVCRPPEGLRTPASECVSENVEAAIDGRRISVRWPWDEISDLARPCAPGNVTVLCGIGGSGKSFWLQEAFLKWHERGIPTAVQHLEKNRAYHLGRALAQLAHCGSVSHDEWQRLNPDAARAAVETHREFLDSYGKTLWDSPGVMQMEAVLNWVRARASDGARIIAVDPITAADAGRERWTADTSFIIACEELAAKCGCSVILVTHPPKGKGNEAPSLDNLAGGTAFARNSDCVMWLQGHHPPVESEIKTPCGPSIYQHNRTVSFCKTRDGTGVGTSVAMNFNPETLETSEIGVIQKRKRRTANADEG